MDWEDAEMKSAILIVVNKWDKVSDKTSKKTDTMIKDIHMSIRYLSYAPIIFVSAVEQDDIRLELAYELGAVDFEV